MSIRRPLSSPELAQKITDIRGQAKDFDSVSDQVVIADANAVILYANPAASAATGFEVEEIVGQNPADLWGGRMPKAFYKQMWRRIKERKEPFIGTVKNVRRNNQEQWQEVYITPLVDTEKNIQYFVGIEYPVPAPLPEKTATKQERMAAAFFIHSPITLLLVVVGKMGTAFYRLGPGGLHRISTVAPEPDIKRTGLFLHTSGETLGSILAHHTFDQVYLFSPPELIASWKELFKKHSITPGAIIAGDYSGEAEPQLLQQVRVTIYSGS